MRVSGIKCWRCSTDRSNEAFCGDPFDSRNVTHQQRMWTYVVCAEPFYEEQNQRAVCKKIIQLGRF